MNVEKIYGAICDALEEGLEVGIRADEHDYNIDDALDASRVWVDGEPTDYILDGTSVTSIIPADGYNLLLGRDGGAETQAEEIKNMLSAIAYNRKTYFGKQYIVAGNLAGYGDDKDEMLLSDARIICAI